jgi:hypothetical protein
MTRVIQTVAVTIPFLIALAVSLGGGEWSKDLWPAWVWVSVTAGLLFLALVWGVFKRAYELENAFQPKIELRFGESGKYITTTPYHGVKTTGKTKRAISGNARKVRVEAINRGPTTAHNCCAFLLAVKRAAPDGTWLDTDFTDTMQLKWSHEDAAGAIDLHSGIHKFFNILSVPDHSNQLSLELVKPLPLRFAGIFDKPGKYMVRVCVRGDDGAHSRNLRIEVDWTGSMDGLAAKVSEWHAESI